MPTPRNPNAMPASAGRTANAVPASRWANRPPAAIPGRRADGTPRVAPGVYLLTREASPQFAKPIVVRVIRELTDRHTYYEWTWIQAYQLDKHGDAVDRRELFVRPDGMRRVPEPGSGRTHNRRDTTKGDR
ncbi:hypothetical protein GCM10011608_24270 [Micromonospora sonchi]|uniref:Uncharacterized protein n=1 Tax=Micromonospora sonchi TaxID=1763543 RepID=A0A917WXC5_9ACTN|nr:hypothetical protein [Micromonospora sonchi]GGM38700.1 hypothetical protein GCM10011608_24270 [Micromonospora sonchi]